MQPRRTSPQIPVNQPRITVRNIRVTHGHTVALDGVSAAIEPGRVTALAGANGSGKSTLLGVLAGIQPWQAGQRHAVGAGRIAMVVQRSAAPDTLPLTVFETVSMGRWGRRGLWRPLSGEDRAIIADSIGALGLAGLERRSLGELSGGQRQRALVAQGLAQRADVLLLDEPAAGLDGDALLLIDLAIRAEADRGVAVVCATHDPAVIRRADRVLRLAAGVLVSHAAPGEHGVRS
ncbi:ABC transporter ATP-binding protein [Cryobacterium zongtaii]|uniref:ABC transporter ATP-binding protein n=1 Tax=Cryobacterium zongtaii TaxID=1259217 RepID=A0A2S3ZGE8_9MICO|nr:zinc ABC transporter ATP-binding protein AztA [Cryobacterium zongtaii]POH66456.1 ABC transporter ATP-binding protein [Cryobacterium zongtaii]